jgi:hypothetical protein
MISQTCIILFSLAAIASHKVNADELFFPTTAVGPS